MAQSVEEIINFLEVFDWLGTAGQPTRDQYPLIKDSGYQAVINLAMPDSTGSYSNEEEVAAENGLVYFHIPVVWGNPTYQDLERFFSIMKILRGKKIFLHCALNMRVSVFVCLYRILVLGEPVEKARELIYEIWEPDEIWERFFQECILKLID